MFKRKKTKDENNMTYFFGGTAIGMAAALLVGKVLSNTSIVRNKHFEPETPVNKNTNNCPRNIQHKNENYEEHLMPTVSFKTVYNDLNNNINNLAVEKKYNKDVQKIFYSNKNDMLYNINMEDNIGYDVSNKILKDCKEENKCNIHPFCESSNMKKELSCVTELESNSENNTEEHLSEAINTESANNLNKESASKQIQICKSIQLPGTFNNLPDDFYDISIVYKNLQNVKSSMINLNLLPSYVINASNMATYNDTCMQFEDEEENKILNFTSFEEFDDTDLISSTKHDDLENV